MRAPIHVTTYARTHAPSHSPTQTPNRAPTQAPSRAASHASTYVRDAKTPEPPWPFIGREDELALIRRSLVAGRHGIVVTGPVGCGKTRLVTEALRGAGGTGGPGGPGCVD